VLVCIADKSSDHISQRDRRTHDRPHIDSVIEALNASPSSVEGLLVIHVLNLQSLVIVLLLNNVLHSIVKARLSEKLVDIFEGQTASLGEEEVLLVNNVSMRSM